MRDFLSARHWAQIGFWESRSSESPSVISSLPQWKQVFRQILPFLWGRSSLAVDKSPFLTWQWIIRGTFLTHFAVGVKYIPLPFPSDSFIDGECCSVVSRFQYVQSPGSTHDLVLGLANGVGSQTNFLTILEACRYMKGCCTSSHSTCSVFTLNM